MKHLIQRICFSLIILSVSLSIIAKETDFSKWKCKLCPNNDGWSGDFTLGFNYVNQDNLGFANYRSYDKKGYYLALDGNVNYRNQDGLFFNLSTKNLGLENRKIKLNTGKQGKYELRFSWSEIVKYRGTGSQTPFLGIGSNNLTLPDNWQLGSTTGDFAQLANALHTNPLKTHRKTLKSGITIKPNTNWQYSFDYENQKKKGTRRFSGGLYLFHSSIFPAPVDYDTNQFKMALAWSGKRSHLSFNLFSSLFKNANHSITWQNPFSFDENTKVLRSSLEPDNSYYQFNVNGSYSYSPKFRLSGAVSIGRSKQNDSFLPYSINPSYSDLILPRSSLNAQLDTNTVNLTGKISSRLTNKLSLTARVKLNERDNKTPVNGYTPVITDFLPDAERSNRPYSYDKQRYSLDVRYRAHRKVNLLSGIKHESLERTLQEVKQTDEYTLWSEIKINPFENSQLKIKFENANRNTSNYRQIDDGGPIDHPLLRKFNQADRDRKRTQLQFDINPLDGFDININYYYANDKYEESIIGLHNSKEKNITFDINYAIVEKINLSAFFSKDIIDSNMSNAEFESSVPWHAQTKDTIFTSGVGLSVNASLKSNFGLDLITSRSNGDISVKTEADENPFPSLVTNFKNLRLNFEYQINDNWGYIIRAEHENYKSNDWAIDDLGVDGISNILTLGTQSANYNAWVIGIHASYNF